MATAYGPKPGPGLNALLLALKTSDPPRALGAHRLNGQACHGGVGKEVELERIAQGLLPGRRLQPPLGGVARVGNDDIETAPCRETTRSRTPPSTRPRRARPRRASKRRDPLAPASFAGIAASSASLLSRPIEDGHVSAGGQRASRPWPSPMPLAAPGDHRDARASGHRGESSRSRRRRLQLGLLEAPVLDIEQVRSRARLVGADSGGVPHDGHRVLVDVERDVGLPCGGPDRACAQARQEDDARPRIELLLLDAFRAAHGFEVGVVVPGKLRDGGLELRGELGPVVVGRARRRGAAVGFVRKDVVGRGAAIGRRDCPRPRARGRERMLARRAQTNDGPALGRIPGELRHGSAKTRQNAPTQRLACARERPRATRRAQSWARHRRCSARRG